MLDAVLVCASFLFDAVYENSTATVEFKKASAILSGLWEKVRERPGGVSRSRDRRDAKASTSPPATSSPA